MGLRTRVFLMLVAGRSRRRLWLRRLLLIIGVAVAIYVGALLAGVAL
jgi:hypothetical protein